MKNGQWAWILRPDYRKGEILNLTICEYCANKVGTVPLPSTGCLDELWENCVIPGVKKIDIINQCAICHGSSVKVNFEI